jgi:peptide/nickel transport system permease protein
MSLLKYTIRRLFSLIPILFGVLFLSFVLTRQMEGNPYLWSIGEGAHGLSTARYQALKESLGLDKPPVQQFFLYLGNLFQGDWGLSLSLEKDKPVWDIIMKCFPRTVEITILAVSFSSIVGIIAGIVSSVHRNTLRDTVIRFIALMGVAIPVFWLGLLLQFVFAYKFDGWFGWSLPGSGFNTIGRDPLSITRLRLLDCLLTGRFDLLWDTILHLIMPVFCLSFISIAGITRYTRSSMLEVLELDYIRTARAKGCKEKQVINKHAFRNALIPTITVIGLNFAGLLGGAVLTEHTFNIRGMGVLTLQSIEARDYFVINACVFMITIVFVVVNLITDIIYGLADPRIRF